VKGKHPWSHLRRQRWCPRYIELWNLVFIQYNRIQISHSPSALESTSIPEWGLERVASVIQKVHGNYDSDSYAILIRATEELTNKRYGDDPEADISFRVLLTMLAQLRS